MTPKDKAKQLYIDMLSWQDNSIEYLERDVISISAKQCALISVDEILNLDLHDVGDYKCFDTPSEWYISYWDEVKHEIEKL